MHGDSFEKAMNCTATVSNSCVQPEERKQNNELTCSFKDWGLPSNSAPWELRYRDSAEIFRAWDVNFATLAEVVWSSCLALVFFEHPKVHWPCHVLTGLLFEHRRERNYRKKKRTCRKKPSLVRLGSSETKQLRKPKILGIWQSPRQRLCQPLSEAADRFSTTLITKGEFDFSLRNLTRLICGTKKRSRTNYKQNKYYETHVPGSNPGKPSYVVIITGY